MDTDKKPEDDKEKQAAAPANDEAKASADASKKPESGNPDKDAEASDGSDGTGKDGGSDDAPAKKPGGLKQTLKKLWLYLVIVLLLGTIGGIFAVVSSLNGKKTPPPPSIQSQSYSPSQLKQLASSGLSSASGQTITIQGDSVLDGQELVKGNMDVATDVQAGGTLSIPALTISNNGTLGNAQVSSLEVATTAALGSVTMQNGLDVSGNTSISDATFGTLTASKLTLPGNGDIDAPSHIMFTGAFPYRTISFGVLGNGGSASVNGSDTSGTVSINTGNNPQPGCFITVIFLIPFTHTPNVLLGPIGLGAAGSQSGDGLHAYATLVADPTSGDSTAFKVCTVNTPLPNQAFAFSYLVDGAPN